MTNPMLDADRVPVTDAERRLVRAARDIVAEHLADGRTADQAWDRVTSVVDADLVMHVIREERTRDGSPESLEEAGRYTEAISSVRLVTQEGRASRRELRGAMAALEATVRSIVEASR